MKPNTFIHPFGREHNIDLALSFFTLFAFLRLSVPDIKPLSFFSPEQLYRGLLHTELTENQHAYQRKVFL